jgi:hypothetical protein
MGLFSSETCSNLSFNIPGLREWIVVDIKKYEKKIIKSQFKLLNLKVSCSFFIKIKDTIINNKVFMLTAKLPTINHRGNV